MDALSPSDADVRRHNNIGSLRLLFAALVVVAHSPELIDGDRAREPLTRLFGTLSFGEVAVDGFFLISGYLIIASFRNTRSIGDYLARRVLRIWPGFIVAYLVSLLVVGPLAGGDLVQIAWPEAFLRLAALAGPSLPGAFQGLPYPFLNGAMWTIPYEFRCYLLVILTGALASRSRRAGYAAMLVALAALYAVHDRVPDIPRVGALFGRSAETIRLTCVFCVGGGFYVWRDRIAYTGRGALLAALALAPLMLSPRLAEPAVALLGGYLIFWYAFACPSNAISRSTDRSDPSYGLYLYAWPVQNLLIASIPGVLPWMVTAITLPVAVVLGLASWHAVEKPALRGRRFVGWARSRRGAEPAPSGRRDSSADGSPCKIEPAPQPPGPA